MCGKRWDPAASVPNGNTWSSPSCAPMINRQDHFLPPSSSFTVRCFTVNVEHLCGASKEKFVFSSRQLGEGVQGIMGNRTTETDSSPLFTSGVAAPVWHRDDV